MKWCLSSRQANSYLAKADEIKVQYRDRKVIYDLREKFKNATIILVMPFDKETVVNWQEISTYNTYTEHNLILCLTNIADAQKCKEENIRFYYGFPVTSFYELNLLKKLGVCYVRLGGSLMFSLDKVKRVGIPVRAVPNIANEIYWPGEDGVCGTWIRPEGVEYCEPYIDAMEFEDCDQEKEQALFRIYAEQKAWPGRVDMLISNITTDALNRLIHPDFSLTRLTCGQKCQEDHRCRYCYGCLDIAEEDVIRDLKESLEAE